MGGREEVEHCVGGCLGELQDNGFKVADAQMGTTIKV